MHRKPSGQVQPVVHMDVAPFPSIAYVWIRRRRGLVTTSTYESSAALLGTEHLLTAAHNVHGTWASYVVSSTVVYSAGTASEVEQDRAFSGRNIAVAASYRWRDFTTDYALISLTRSSPITSQFRLPHDSEPPIAEGEVVHVAGFPAEGGFQNRRLYYGSGDVSKISQSTFQYAVDTGGGMSGSPIWVERSDGEGMHCVIVGIHVGFADGLAVGRRTDEAAFQTFLRSAKR